MKKLAILSLILFSIFSYVSCDGGVNGVSSAIIGPEGGSITSSDGRLILTFPPGALFEETEITIRRVDPTDLGPGFEGLEPDLAYELLPDGLEFDVPVTATLTLDEAPIQPDGSLEVEGRILLITSSDGVVEILEGIQEVDVDADTATLSAELDGFSTIEETRNGIKFMYEGIPDGPLEVGDKFTTMFTIDISMATIDTDTNEVFYSDFSTAPIKIISANPKTFPIVNNVAKGESEYTCTAPGTGVLEPVLFFSGGVGG